MSAGFACVAMHCCKTSTPQCVDCWNRKNRLVSAHVYLHDVRVFLYYMKIPQAVVSVAEILTVWILRVFHHARIFCWSKEKKGQQWSQILLTERTWGANAVTSHRGLANESENQDSWSPIEEDKACCWSWDLGALHQHSQGTNTAKALSNWESTWLYRYGQTVWESELWKKLALTFNKYCQCLPCTTHSDSVFPSNPSQILWGFR